MSNYIDFPELSEEQYLKILSHYQSADALKDKSDISISFSYIENSLYNIKQNCNYTLATSLDILIKSISQLNESFCFVYNIKKSSHSNSTTNPYLIIKSLNNAITLLLNSIYNETRIYYLGVLKKMLNNLLQLSSRLCEDLSNQTTKTYKHF